ncbi:UNVERIFIED_CONTAM: hypothetical protein Sangu_2297500 [Sesamum angustifolium]|uniref:Aminotransferase-like plant mobile domain-containing protein n=1 Tax=Sesamum angustifolium TaxID=2727405 RepID=A0AAW2L9V8_9LAMI
MSILVTNHQTTSPIYALWAVLSLEVMQKWDDDLRFTGEFRYTKGYWEWTEDVLSRSFCEAWCPLTNTLLTSAGEMSISLWDLHELVGLPITGCLYDEVVPNALELIGVDEKRERFIPRSSCWLCLFVFPGNDVNSIRPSTFKMASLMANGRRVNLAIPVLASIYEGLNTIATSPKPVGTSHSFPIHFVYTWLVCYFKTHYSVWQELRGPKMTRFSEEGGAKYYEPREARKRIHKAEFVSWACNMLVKAEPFKFIVEPYSPHRFGRQFGYYQDVPGTLKYDTRVASLEKDSATGAYVFYRNLHQKLGSLVCLLMLRNSARKLIKHDHTQRKKDEDKQVDGGENDPPCALVPPIVIECDSQAAVVEVSKGKCSSHNMADSDSSNKDRHWKRQRKEATPLKAAETNASQSSLANLLRRSYFLDHLEGEVQSIDVGGGI